ncbi:MAG: SMP-30/gluconolactonase/LRE family protein [Dehalococcoidia bacterium]|nr:SMP-30/gluconolactonase/LRE family protein [Dehalococcoidia bacterium]
MKVEVLATGLEFPEGPFITAKGELVVTEINGGRLRKIAMDGTTELFADTGGGPNGAALAPDGSVYVCNNGGTVVPGSTREPEPGRVQRVLPDGTVETFIAEVEGVPLDAPNDCVFDADGGFWFTNPDGFGKPGSICYRAPDGTAVRAATGILFPNGIGISPDGRFLVVCESNTGMLLSYKIEGPGKLSGPRPNGNIGRRSIPDGFSVDSAGRMIVAGFQTNNLFVLDMADGRPIEVIELPDHGVTNSCFGGPDHRTLFITSSEAGQVLRMEWPVPGLRLH